MGTTFCYSIVDVPPSSGLFIQGCTVIPVGFLFATFPWFFLGWEIADSRSDAQKGHDWSMGTFCSGTDCAVVVFRNLLEAASESLNIPADQMPEFRHVFSCEKDSNKKTFIQDFFPGVRVHDDALDPIRESTRFVSAGFPCDDASALHPRSASQEHRLCVSQAMFFGDFSLRKKKVED